MHCQLARNCVLLSVCKLRMLELDLQGQGLLRLHMRVFLIKPLVYKPMYCNFLYFLIPLVLCPFFLNRYSILCHILCNKVCCIVMCRLITHPYMHPFHHETKYVLYSIIVWSGFWLAHCGKDKGGNILNTQERTLQLKGTEL